MEYSSTASAPAELNKEVCCKGCQRYFSSLLKNLSKKRECQKNYDLEDLRQKSAAATCQKKKEYQKIYDEEHKTGRRETQKFHKYHKYHTDSEYKEQKNLYQKKYDKDNYEQVRMIQSVCNLAAFQTYPEVKKQNGNIRNAMIKKNIQKRKENGKRHQYALFLQNKYNEDEHHMKMEAYVAVKHIQLT